MLGIQADTAIKAFSNYFSCIEVEEDMFVEVCFTASVDNGVSQGDCTAFRLGFIGLMADGTHKNPELPEYVWGIAYMTANQTTGDIWLSNTDVFASGSGASTPLSCIAEQYKHMPEPLAKAAVEWFVGDGKGLRQELVEELSLPDDELAEFILKMFG